MALKRGKGPPGVPTVMDPGSMARALIDVPEDVRGHMLDSLPISELRAIVAELVLAYREQRQLIAVMNQLGRRSPASPAPTQSQGPNHRARWAP